MFQIISHSDQNEKALFSSVNVNEKVYHLTANLFTTLPRIILKIAIVPKVKALCSSTRFII